MSTALERLKAQARALLADGPVWPPADNPDLDFALTMMLADGEVTWDPSVGYLRVVE